MSEAWKSGLFGCFDDCGICLVGSFCTPCLYGQNVAKKDGVSCLSPCISYSYLTCLVAGPNRTALRNKYNLAEEPCGDCMVHCFCTPCAVCQEARELKARA